MKFTLLIATVVASVSAQGIPGVPTCGMTCIMTAATSAKGCSISDQKCFCKDPAIIEALKTCIPKSCTAAADVQATYDMANKNCAGVQGFTPFAAPGMGASPGATPPKGTPP
ncbi:hypothetical protein FKW77_004649 [Venturia effusa]|uniref:CFEM domain-containing protein n=1 Tax=Venturia effusa TaxID=50376 RepID=A0A517L965_9PEZI|nr:hypothetical protein FKW77_004649 [Venturia effusa]